MARSVLVQRPRLLPELRGPTHDRGRRASRRRHTAVRSGTPMGAEPSPPAPLSPGWDHDLCRAVLAVYARVLLSFQRRRARRRDLRDGHSGCVTVIQRFGGGLNLNIHFHTLVLDGVFTEGGGGTLPFRPLPPPTDGEVGAVLATIYVRVCRLLRRQGFDETAADLSRPDPIAEESPMLAGISSASIHGRVALGPRAGRRVWRMGDEPDAPWVLSSDPRHAHIAGFDLHADVAARCGPRAPRAALPLSAPAAGRTGPAAADGRRPYPAHAEDALGGRHAPSALRADGAPRKARCPDPAPTDQPDPLSRRARAARELALPHRRLWYCPRRCSDGSESRGQFGR